MRRRYPCLDGGLPRPPWLLRWRHSVTRGGFNFSSATNFSVSSPWHSDEVQSTALAHTRRFAHKGVWLLGALRPLEASEHYDAHFSQAVRVARLVVGLARLYLWCSVFFASTPRMQWLAADPKSNNLSDCIRAKQTLAGFTSLCATSPAFEQKTGSISKRLWLWLL